LIKRFFSYLSFPYVFLIIESIEFLDNKMITLDYILVTKL